MPPFRYQAARADGHMVTGLLHGESRSYVSAALVRRGLHPIRIEMSPEERVSGPAVSRRDLSLAFQSIAALVGAGVPVERAVAAAEPLTRGALRECVAQAGAALREGRSVADALSTRGGVVPPAAIGILRAGERSGRLAEAFAQVAAGLERDAELLARVRQALAYPLLVLVLGLASVVVIVTTVIPRFAALLKDSGAALPPATALLLRSGQLMADHGVALLLFGAAAVSVAATWLRRPAGRLLTARFLLAVPIAGDIRCALATARMSRALAAMLGTGMPLLAALDGARQAAADPAIGERLLRVRDRVTEGESLTGALGRERAVVPLALQLYAAGEGSGQLPTMAARAGDLAETDALRGLQTLIGLIEPVLVIGMGALVAFIAGALLQAVYSLRPGV